MTKPLTTPYSVGDTVRCTRRDGSVKAGDVGVIRRIFISDPQDGDQTFLLCDVDWLGYGGVCSALPNDHEDFKSGIAPAPPSVYTARRLAKRVAAQAKKLANDGADLTPIISSLDLAAEAIEANTAWLRRRLGELGA